MERNGNNNDLNYSPVGVGGGVVPGGGGAPVIAPTFISAPTAPGTAYSAPVAPVAPVIPAFGGFGGFSGGNNGFLESIIALGLVSNGNFGGNRGNDHCHDGNAFPAAILGKLGSLEGAVPLAASNIQNAILEQTGAVTSQINQVGLAQLNATTGVKDSVQNVGLALLQATNTQGEATRALITQLNTDNLNRLLTVSDLDRRDERNLARSREIEVNVTQNVNQQQAQLQAQAQQQAQFNALFSCVNALVGDIQAVKQGQVIFNSGTMAASGTQAAANTKVA